MTYSILAVDRATGEIGAAVQSHYFAVGRRCLTVAPGIGAVASQSFGSAAHGPTALAALAERRADLPTVLAELVADDANRRLRQILLLDASGRGVAYTGSGCVPRHGSASADGVVAAGNMLSADCWHPMVEAFQSTPGPLEHRLLAALDAAQAAGGDIRGQMSAACKVVGPQRTEWIPDGTRVDIRVDHHDEPLAELRRLVTVANAHRVLSQLVFAPGLVAGVGAAGVGAAGPPDVDAVLTALARAQQVLVGDYEPTFWQGVVAWRAGRSGQARALLGQAVRHRPDFREFLSALAQAGLIELPAGGTAELLGPAEAQ
ncbi:MAG: hypothetical protein JWO63_1819 [Frankiales bacterium]|nr:hypothetical protein [Frankiales bacterium]